MCKVSLQNESNLIGWHGWTPPIVEIVLQVSIADAELEFLQEFRVLHQIQRVKDVIMPLFRKTNNKI